MPTKPAAAEWITVGETTAKGRVGAVAGCPYREGVPVPLVGTARQPTGSETRISK